ncbi:MAG TPA: DUF58 domain-containing protein [Anaerolineales bacterium]|nr:DUF58 domain-containing protein [Anaerolineales bacterium]HNQ95720.1 DUF58 domain-containing protein [Anaerolineales bacterium]HNS61517.1 DUF58 domain-containing protein [Anaerolineales bacterium]
MLFDESTLRKLNQLTLIASRIRSGAMKGERRSSRRGSSVEFADYRNYAPGDDLRRLDWNIYARLERPFIKLLEEEEDLAVHVLIDGSQSMDWGEGAQNKFQYALKLAAGLGAVTLASGDALTIGLLQQGKVASEFGPSRGGASLARLFRFLENLEPGGETNLNRAMRDYSIIPRRAGLVILLSDLFANDGYETGLRQLMGRGHEAALVHVLAPDELDPPLAGDIQLVDIETNQTQDVSLDGGLRERYRTRARAWIQSTQAECRKRNIRYLEAVTSQTWDHILLLEMRRAGFVK